MPRPALIAQVIAVVVVMGSSVAQARAELVTNGGFEAGEFFPWIAPPSIPNQSVFRVSGGGGHSGEYYAKMGSTSLQFVGQVLPTTAGEDYELSFWLRRPSNFPALFRVRWEGQVAFSQPLVLPDSVNWHQFTIPLHANLTGSFLEFGQMDFPGEFHIDDISLVQVPAPSAAPLLAMAGVTALRRRR